MLVGAEKEHEDFKIGKEAEEKQKSKEGNIDVVIIIKEVSNVLQEIDFFTWIHIDSLFHYHNDDYIDYIVKIEIIKNYGKIKLALKVEKQIFEKSFIFEITYSFDDASIKNVIIAT